MKATKAIDNVLFKRYKICPDANAKKVNIKMKKGVI